MVFRRYGMCEMCKQTKRTSVKNKGFVCRRCRGFKRRLFSQISGNENYPYVLDDRDILVLLCLEKENLPSKLISERTEMPISTTYRVISRLIDGGFIEKKGMLFSLTSSVKDKILELKGWDLESFLLKKKKENGPCMRFHKFQGKLAVINPPDNYENYLNKFLKIPIGRSRKLNGFKLVVSGCLVVFLSPTAISITLPDVYVNSLNEHRVAEGYCKLGILIDTLIEKLERMFKGLKIDCLCPFEPENQEIAIKDSVYARKYYEKHKDFLNEGKIITDNSHGHHELEAVNPKTAGQDIVECLNMEKEAQRAC